MPKEMLPIVDKPAIQYIVEEAAASGIEDILIITTVSYTHLDVYKRQVEHLHAQRHIVFLGNLGQNTHVPVSYTHLDVYKRQLIDSPGLSQQDYLVFPADTPGFFIPHGGLHFAYVGLSQQKHAKPALADSTANCQRQLTFKQHAVCLLYTSRCV